jgi:hypothetical protein
MGLYGDNRCDSRTKHVNALSGKMQCVFQMLQQVGYERLK